MTAHGVGVRLATPDGHRNEVVISRNTPVPAHASHVYMTAEPTHAETFIRVEITQGDTNRADLAELLGTGRIEGFPAGRPAGEQVRVSMEFDGSGRLHVGAVHLGSGKRMTLTLKIPGGLSRQEIQEQRDHLQDSPSLRVIRAANDWGGDPDDGDPDDGDLDDDLSDLVEGLLDRVPGDTPPANVHSRFLLARRQRRQRTADNPPHREKHVCLAKRPSSVATRPLRGLPETSGGWGEVAMADACPQSEHWGPDPQPDKQDHPVVNIAYDDAQAYADWAGKELPTREQWARAFRGDRNWLFPWGDAYDATFANVGDNPKYPSTSPVEETPQDVSSFGVYNLVGNASEFIRGTVPLRGRPRRVIKGADWKNPGFTSGIGSNQTLVGLTTLFPFIGFRCVVEDE